MSHRAAYPSAAADRDRFVLDLRPPRPRHDPWRYQDLLVEDERTAEGPVVCVGTIFLTGRECPWRCVMCDLWRYTIAEDTPRGATAAQIAAARRVLSDRCVLVPQLKLYNAGSFFDPRAVPEGDYDDIARALTGLDRVIVESHPLLIGSRVDLFIDALGRQTGRDRRPPQLEVAMGLETAHAEALRALHKRMTVDDFARAADRLRTQGVAIRAFLLISPPFVPPDQQDAWLLRSIAVAFSSGASVVSLVPSRSGNGALEALAAAGEFREPRLADIERSVEAAYKQAGGIGRVFVDLWDLARFSDCPACVDARRRRLHAMNLEQRHLPPVACSHCGR